MSKKDPNLSRRDGQYYYRASFSLDGKVCLIRLTLNTSDRSVARQKGALMDRLLKDQWRKIVSEQEGLNETDKASILRATAIQVRDGLDHLHASEQADGHARSCASRSCRRRSGVSAPDDRHPLHRSSHGPPCADRDVSDGPRRYGRNLLRGRVT